MISSGRTDVGKRRDDNQDNIFVSDGPVGTLPNLYIVADGMGGHAAGDFASRYAIQKVVEFVKNSTVKNPISLLRRALISANDEVYQEAKKDVTKGGMGTTMVVCVVDGSRLICGNIGDSRLYLIKGETPEKEAMAGANHEEDNNEIVQITMDHSLVEELIRTGQLDRNKGRNHPEKNIITRAMGSRDEAVPDFFEVTVSPGDRILLCSDGLSNMVENDEIRDIIREHEDLTEAVNALIDRANYYGGNANISAVVVGV